MRPVPVARLDLVSVGILARADAESHPHCMHRTSRTQKAAVSAQSQVVCQQRAGGGNVEAAVQIVYP